jgi:hypothetical protein
VVFLRRRALSAISRIDDDIWIDDGELLSVIWTREPSTSATVANDTLSLRLRVVV